jgi:hypothetical protein
MESLTTSGAAMLAIKVRAKSSLSASGKANNDSVISLESIQKFNSRRISRKLLLPRAPHHRIIQIEEDFALKFVIVARSMKRVRPFFFCFLLGFGSIFSQAVVKPIGDAVPYRLLGSSTLTVETNGVATAASILSGTFTLTRQLSPLDWDSFSLDNIRWFSTNATTSATRITGNGTYSITTRFGNTRELNLATKINDVAVNLQSGAVPDDSNWPIIDIVVAGTDANGVNYSLHLVAAPELQRWHYRLLESSSFLDDCLICDHVSIYQPVRGSFDLVLIDGNPLNSRYLLRDIDFTATLGDQIHTFTGEGSFEFGGEVALRQNMTLHLKVQSGATIETKTFTNTTSAVQMLWPVIDVNLDETEGTPVHTYRLHLLAAPLREIWFSTVSDFGSGNNRNNRTISNGDILSDLGRVVVPNIALMRPFGLNPDLRVGIDALAIVPGGEVQFSLNNDFTSAPAGQIHHGDLLSDKGNIVKRNQDLLAAFGIMPTAPDAGLDAVQIMDNGEILFSITQDIFSEIKGTTLHKGDLLSNKGDIKKTNSELLSRFHPTPIQDYGLDAVYVWPSGEIWFSTEQDFNDQGLGPISEGDLLSDQGYVVFRNLELLQAFKPLEKIANFGLDGLYIVTDASERAAGPVLSSPLIDRANDIATLHWQSPGRVVQLQKTTDLRFPFVEASRIIPGTTWIDTPLQSNGAVFYRLRQW